MQLGYHPLNVCGILPGKFLNQDRPAGLGGGPDCIPKLMPTFASDNFVHNAFPGTGGVKVLRKLLPDLLAPTIGYDPLCDRIGKGD